MDKTKRHKSQIETSCPNCSSTFWAYPTQLARHTHKRMCCSRKCGQIYRSKREKPVASEMDQIMAEITRLVEARVTARLQEIVKVMGL